jgi:hypothetical protein
MNDVVQVYRNVHQSRRAGVPVYSIRDKKTRRVIGHATSIIVTDAVFHVNESGRQRTLVEKRKNVHAWVEGHPARVADITGAVPVTYNPYKGPTFVNPQTGDPIHRATAVELSTAVYAVVC